MYVCMYIYLLYLYLYTYIFIFGGIRCAWHAPPGNVGTRVGGFVSAPAHAQTLRTRMPKLDHTAAVIPLWYPRRTHRCTAVAQCSARRLGRPARLLRYSTSPTDAPLLMGVPPCVSARVVRCEYPIVPNESDGTSGVRRTALRRAQTHASTP